ncbi:MAG: hypothetical protein KME06_12685 [Kastovskya adunca ATA6-11-RM4]|nr:hypothetical protein [Kastovskya adunca ATA6-11-RM4]
MYTGISTTRSLLNSQQHTRERSRFLCTMSHLIAFGSLELQTPDLG